MPGPLLRMDGDDMIEDMRFDGGMPREYVAHPAHHFPFPGDEDEVGDDETAEEWKPRVTDEFFDSLQIRDFAGHTDTVHSLAWNCIGQKLASGSLDHTIRIWDLQPSSSKISSLELKGHAGSVENVAWDPSSPDILTSISSDKTIRLWDIRTAKCEKQLELTAGNINAVYHKSGSEIAVGNEAEELSFVDVGTFTVRSSRAFKCEVNEFAWDPTGTLLFVTTGTGSVEVLEYSTLDPVLSFQAHAGGVHCIAMDPLESLFALGSADGLVTLWDLDSLNCEDSFDEMQCPVRTIGFSFDGEYLAFGSEDLFINIAEVETGESIHQFGINSPMNSISWNPREMILAFSEDDGQKHGNKGTFQVLGFDSSDSESVKQIGV